MPLILRIASTLVTVYSFVIIFRVLVTMFSGEHYGPPWRVLYAVTDPVLRLFHGLRFLRTATVDFTPIAAIVTLQILASLLWSFSNAAFFNIATVFAALLLAVWRIFFWIMVFFTVVAVIRLISLFVRRRPAMFFFQMLDNILASPARLASSFFPRRQNSDYRTVLGVMSFVLVFLCIIGLFVVEPALGLLCYYAGLRVW